MLYVQVILYCFTSRMFVSPQAFLWENKQIGNDYMMEPKSDSKDNDGIKLLTEGGVPNDVAKEGIKSLTIFKQYKIKENKLLNDVTDKKERNKLKRKLSKKVPKQCRGDNVCLDMEKCLACAEHWEEQISVFFL